MTESTFGASNAGNPAGESSREKAPPGSSSRCGVCGSPNVFAAGGGIQRGPGMSCCPAVSRPARAWCATHFAAETLDHAGQS